MTNDVDGMETKQEARRATDALNALDGQKPSADVSAKKSSKKSGGLFSWLGKPKTKSPAKTKKAKTKRPTTSNKRAKAGAGNAVFAKAQKDTKKDGQFWNWLAIASGVVVLISMLSLSYFVPSSNAFVRNIGELRLLSQQIIASSEAATGSYNQKEVAAALDKLGKDQARFNDILSGMSVTANPQIQAVANDWQVADQQIGNILKQRSEVVELNKTVSELYPAIDEIKVFYNDVVNQMLNAGTSANQTVLAKNQVILAERILRSVGIIAVGSQGTFDSADDFLAAANFFGSTLSGQLNGNAELSVERVAQPQIRQQLEIIKDIYDETLYPSVQRVSGYVQGIESVRQSADTTIDKSKSIAENLQDASTSVASQLGVYLSALLLLLSFLALLYAIYKILQLRAASDRKRSEVEAMRQRKEAEVEMQRAEKIQQENDRNQTAILRLLDELGDLADGDLTVNATVSEDFTGAIADSVNFAIDQLRLLVSAINATAIEVTKSSESTQNTAMQLAESSEHQAQEIAGASAAINEMAVSIDQVSANAVESATVADRSVAIAYNGAEVVQRSIDGMNTIREQIQETAKRIKRLGESSQEIGDIISLINDIADQTNILALNAAIQASSAGEAGRGFAVVADEVQRLAERSANATKQIETLVKTIQADTNEAVTSMELTTAEVVKGAKLAKDAGEALEEVQTVSNTLADLIQNISNAARQQAASAGHISNTMNIIQEITTQTTAGTIATARSVGQLNDMANALRESVSGFTLPEDDQTALSASL